MTKYYYVIAGLVGIILGILSAEEATSKPFNNDGICETIVVENGEVISRESYPCE